MKASVVKKKLLGLFSCLNFSANNCGRKHKLEIDPSAGSVVQDIFKMKLQGMSQDAIANRLNELGILSPFEYKISSGSRYKTGFRQKEQALWSSVTVRRILENEVYIGNLA